MAEFVPSVSEEEVRFVFDAIARDCHWIAVGHGWWENERSFGDVIALLHSELSEALEAYRVGNPSSEKAEGYSQIEEEFADVLIRLFDFANKHELDLAGAMLAKMRYNHGRPYRHGGKEL